MREDFEAIRVMGFWYWAFCRTGLYRFTMKVAHRLGWHYAPIGNQMEDGSRYRWCQWCGMRDRVIDTSRGPLHG